MADKSFCSSSGGENRGAPKKLTDMVQFRSVSFVVAFWWGQESRDTASCNDGPVPYDTFPIMLEVEQYWLPRRDYAVVEQDRCITLYNGC